MYKIRSAATAAAVTLGLLLAASRVTAQTSAVVKTKGLMVGAHINGSSVKFGEIKEDGASTSSSISDDTESGAGGGLIVGWGFTKWLMVYGGFDIAKIKIKGLENIEDFDGPFEILPADYALTHADLGARFSFPSPNHGLVPYLNAALSARVVTAEIAGEEISLSGPAATIGGGFQYFFNPKLALDANVQFTAGKFKDAEALGVKVDLEKFGDVENSNSARVNVGLRFYPHFGSMARGK